MNIAKWDLNLKVRIIGETVNSFLFWMYFPFMMLYFADLFGEKLAGLLMVIPPIIGIFANLFGGYATDRYGRKIIMITSLGIQSGLLVLFALSDNPWFNFMLFNALTAMGSIYRPASMAMVADLVPVEKRREVFAAFYTAVNLGVVVGPLLGAFFFFNYRELLILSSALVTFTIFMVMTKILRETLPPSAKNTAVNFSIAEQFRNYSVIFSDKLFFLYIVAGILITQVFMQLDLLLGVYLKKYFPEQVLNIGSLEIFFTGEKVFAWLFSENGLLVVLFGVLITKLFQSWSDERALVVSSLLFGLSFWLMVFTTKLTTIFLLMALFTLAELIRTPVIQNFITKIAPEDKRGQYIAASTLQFSVARIIAPLAVSLLAYFTPEIIFTLVFLSSIMSVFVYRRMFKLARTKMNESIQVPMDM